jgi:hypothetical protein
MSASLPEPKATWIDYVCRMSERAEANGGAVSTIRLPGGGPDADSSRSDYRAAGTGIDSNSLISRQAGQTCQDSVEQEGA